MGARLVERAVVVGRDDPDHRGFDRVGTHRLEPFDEPTRLLARPSHENALAEQRARVEPPQVFAQRGHATHHENRRPPLLRFLHRCQQLVNRADDRDLGGERAVIHNRRRVLARPAVRDQRSQHLRKLLRAGVTDDGAVEVREACPIDRRRRFAVVFVPAHEGERVAAAGIGGGDAGVAGNRHAGRNARDDLEAHALLVKEQRLGSTAVEDERIAPLEPGHGLALARLLGEQVTDRFLLERLRRRDTDVDLLGVRTRVPQQAWRHDVIVENDVRRGEVLQAAHSYQSGIARARADQINDRHSVSSVSVSVSVFSLSPWFPGRDSFSASVVSQCRGLDADGR